MISYDNYKNRIEKLAKVKRRLHKFRFLICGALVLVIGATVGLMCAKGAYTSDMSLSAQSVYFNEPYEVTPAKAFLCTASEQYIEYRAEGGGWTSAKPVKAGRYEARTASKKIGGYSYSPSVEFEILPLEAEFTVTGTSMTYGDAPSFTVPQLVSGHRVDKSALEFTYASYGAPATEVNVQKDSIKILDASGDDFSDCYDFVKVTGKTLNINKRNITVTPASYEFTYDGIAHAPDGSVTEETQKRLVTGDTLTVTTSVSGLGGALAGGAVNAGGYTVELNGLSLTHGGADISAWYNVTRGSSSMQINRRPLTVTTGSAEKVYDGTPAENTRFTADNLVAGHSAAIRKSTLPKNADVGSYENVFGIAISDGVSDVTDNYALTFDAGTLKINPAALTVTTATPEAHTYDGKPFTDFSFSVKETLSESFTVSAVERLGGDTTDAGSYDNAFAVAVTLNGEDVTRNFKIDYTYGKLVVNKRKMTITTGSDTKVYDGQPFVCDNPVVVGLVPEHRCEIVSGFSVTNVTGEKGVKNDVKYTVYNEYGREVGNKNYEIEHVSGTLIIEPLRIEIHTATDSREYDGTPLINTNYTVVRLNAYGEGLCGADVLTPAHVTSITDVANVVNGCTYTLPTYDGVHSNYELDSYVFGTLKIEPKKVTVNINPVAADYGEKIPDNGFTLDCTALPNDETLTFTTHIEKAGVIVTPETWEGYTLLDAGDYEITPTEGTQKITGGNASLNNYDFTYVNGALEIGARGIIVTTATASHIYDGNEFSDTSYTTVYADGEGKGLLKGDALTVISYMAVRTIDDIPTPNVVKYAVPNGNYKIVETKYGTLTITPRPIIVYTGSAEKTYDGNPLYNEEYSVKYAVWDESAEEWTADEEKVGLIAGDTLACKTLCERTHAGVGENTSKYENGNYDIKRYINGTLTVNALKVHAKLAEDTLTYVYGAIYEPEAGYKPYVETADAFVDADSGEPLALPDELGQKQKLYVKWLVDGAEGSPAVGTYKLVPDEIVRYVGEWMGGFDSDFTAFADTVDYEIKVDDATLIVEKLKFEVTVTDKTIFYGDSLPSIGLNDYTIPESVEDTAKGLGQLFRFEFTYKEENVKDVGIYHFDIAEVTVTDFGYNVKEGYENNYEVTCAGTLKVTAKRLTIQLQPATALYGKPITDPESKVGNLAYDDKITEMTFGYTLNGQPVEKLKNAGTYGTTLSALEINGIAVALASENENYYVEVVDSTLTITPAPLTITFAEITGVTYGDTWAYPDDKTKIEGLKYNEELSFAIKYTDAGGNAVAEPKNAGTYDINPDKDTYAIKNEDGTDGLISNYAISVESGSLTIGKREVHAKFGGLYYITYGEDLPEFKYTFHERDVYDVEYVLPYDEIMTFTFCFVNSDTEEYVDTPKDAGSYHLDINSVFVDGVLQTNDSSNYILYIAPPWFPTLVIERKVVSPVLEDFSKVYGDEISYEFGIVDQFSPEGYEYLGHGERVLFKVRYLQNGEEVSPVFIGVYDIEIVEYNVYDKDGNFIENGENNYYFRPELGKMTITARPITVTIDDQTATYGDTLPENSFTVTDGAMQYDEALSLTYKYDREVKDVGEYDITENKIFIDGKEIDRENCNYAFTFIAGTLTVGQKTINVEIAKDYAAIYGEALPTLTATAEGLVPGDTFEATTFRYYTAEDKLADITPRNAGEYYITVKTAKINGIETPLESEEGNYYITVTDGLLTIGQAELKLVLSQLKTVAYGNPYGYPAGKGNFDKTKTTGLITGDELELAVKYTYRGCDSTLVKPDFESTAPPVNAALYYVKLVKEKSYLHTAYGEKLALGLNYKVSCKDGQFTINPRNVDVYYSFSDYVYGQTVAKPEFTIKVFKNADDPADFSTINLPYGETCDFDLEYYDGKNPSVTQPKNAGKYKVGVINEYVNGKTEFACNYIFTVNDGKDYADLTITPKPIEITLDDMTATYGDFELAKPETHTFTPTEGVLEYTDKLTVKIDFTAVGDEATANYITPENVGLYSIVAKEFAVTYFDGATETAAGDKLKNYVITCNHGTLTVKPKPLNLVISDIDGIFYGDTITPNSYKVYDGETEYTFADGETLSVSLAYFKGENTDVKPKNADTYGVTVKSLTFNGTAVAPTEEGYAAGNYIIKVTNGTLTITPRPVIVYTGSAEKPYDGTPLTKVDYDAVKYAVQNETTGEWTADESKAGLIAGDTLALKGDAVYRTAAGETANANKYENANYDIKTYVNGTLTVTQRGIEIKLNKGGVTSFIYGTPYAGAIRNAEISGAVSGEEIEVAVVYSVRGGAQTTPKDVGGYTATLNFNGCTVTDKDGEVEGGINNYYLSAECAPVDFEIAKMTLTVSVENAERIYGEPVPAALAYSVAETMPAGESLTLAFSFAQEDGKLPVHVKEGGYPVTVAGAEIEGGKISNYALKYTNANPTLTINAKPVSIRLSDIGATYGKPVVYTVKPDNYDKDNSDPLIEGDKLTVTEVKYIQGNTEFTSDNAPVNAGTYGIALVSCKIVNADGEDVTGDYDVEGLNGRLLIDSALVTVYTGSVDEIYDGNAHFTKEATFDGDITGYRLVADEENICKQIDATDENGVDNKTKFKIVDGSGKETDNFTIIYGPDNKTYGKLVVRPKPVGVTIDNATAVYGVQPALTFGTVGLVGEESLSFAVEYDGGAVSPTVGGGYFVMPVGTYSMTFLENSAQISGGRGKASNYAFTFNENAQFTVTPRHINVTTANARKVYDGTPLTKTDGYTTKWVLDGAEQNKAGLINGETLTVDFTASLTDVGDCPNACTYTANGNYVIDKVNAGKLTVTRLSVTAKTADVVETYDGKPHSSGVVTDVDRKLVEGHRFVVTSDPIGQIDVTAGVSNVLTVKIMCGDEDVTDNYTVIYRYGKITIDKRPVTITTGGVSGVIYDGQPHGSEEYSVSDGLLTELKHGLKVNKTFAYVNATDEKGVENAIIFDIYCGDKNVTGNYEITYDYGRIIIGKRPVTVALNGGVEVEYGEDYAAALTRGALTLVAGDTYKLAISADADGIGEFTAAVDWENSKFLNADGKNVKDNYAFTCVPETVRFTILPRNITVTLNAGGRTVFVYGEDYDTAMRNARIDRAVAGDTFEVTVSYGGETPKYVGDNYTAELVGIGNENYNVIKCDPVGFKIVAKDLYFYMEDITVGYGEAPVYPDGVKGFRCIGLVGGDSVEVAPAFEKDGERVIPEYAGTYDIVCGGITVNGGAVSADNYNIVTSKKGTLIINGESLLIERLPLEKYYDGAPLKATDGDIKYYLNGVEGAPLGGCTIVLDGEFATKDGNVSSSCLNAAKYKVEGENAGNYEISYVDNGARLEIKPLAFEVEVADMTQIYGETFNTGKYYTAALINGETLSYRVKLVDAGAVLNAGTYGITGNESGMTFVSGGKAENYVISFKEGTLTVTQRRIMVRTATAEREYDGTAFAKPEGYATFLVIDGKKQAVAGLVNGDKLTPETWATRTEVGSCQNVCAYTVSDNYFIEEEMYEYGTLTVTKKSITVTTGGIDGTYRGTPYSNGDFTYDITLPVNYAVERIGDPAEFLAATRNGKNEFAVRIKNAAGDDVSESYDIHYVYGKVVIARATLTVKLNDAQTRFDYGDNSFDGKFKQGVTVTGLVGGDTLTTVALSYNTADGSAPINAGDYTASLDLTNSFISYAGEGNGIGNYVIDCAEINFTVARLKITLSLDKWAAIEYDGNSHAYGGGYSITDGALAEGETLANVAVKYCADAAGERKVGVPKNAGTYYVFPDLDATMVRRTDYQSAISKNYEVTCGYVTFTIDRKALVITLDDAVHTYDGKAYDYKKSGGVHTNLCAGDSIDYDAVYSDTPVNFKEGGYTVTLENISYSDNYTLDEANSRLTCKLTIKKRDITVKVADRNVERGDEEYSKADITAVAVGGGEGFVNGDLDNATVTFSYADKLPLPENAVALKTVTVSFGGGVMNNYNVVGITAGTLTVTERKVLVTPVFKGNTPYVYDGNAVDLNLFGYTHVHNVANAAADDYGFTAEDAAGFTATYVFTDENGNEVAGAPVNAGKYTVRITLSGAGLGGYYIEYEEITFEIAKRPLTYTVEVDGAGEYVYSGERPSFSATLADGYDGFINGNTCPAYTVELFKGGEPATRYNVGTYAVMISFAGMENYEINAKSAEIKIVERTLVIIPKDPYGGAPQTYNGSNLKLGPEDYTVKSAALVAACDELTVTSNEIAPTSQGGSLKISGVSITDKQTGENVAGNYVVYYTYDRQNAAIKELGLTLVNFSVKVSYEVQEIHYKLGAVGKSVPYTGKEVTYPLDAAAAITLADGYALYKDHMMSFTKSEATVPAAAGVYPDIVKDMVCVRDRSGNVLSVYNLVCDYSAEAVITVVENVVSVDLSGLSADTLTSGTLSRAVTFADEDNACNAEVTVYDLDGKWLIGITLFSDAGADLSANYKLDENCKLDGAEVRIITLAEAKKFKLPALGVEIKVTAAQLESGRGTLYAFDNESRWVLQESCYTVTGTLLEGHKLQVLVFRENGNYLLGVTVYSETDGKRSEESAKYRLRDIVATGVSARYVEISEAASLPRELCIDFGGAFNADGTPKVENGFVTGYTVEGLNVTDSHVLEITAEKSETGYILTAVIYQNRRQGKFDVGDRYELVYTAPAGVQAVKGTVN